MKTQLKEVNLSVTPLRNFAGLSSFEMLAMFRRGLFYAYLSIYLRHHLGLSVTETTLFATLPMIVNVLAQTLVWGKLSDRLQMRRTLIIIGEVLAAGGTVLIWYVHRQFSDPRAAGYAIILGLAIIEIFWSMSNISWSALVSDIYDERQRSRIQGWLASLGGIGRMIGVWIGGLLYDGLGRMAEGWGFFEGPLFFVAAGAMLISTLPLFFLPEGGIATHPAPGISGDHSKKTTSVAAVYLVFLAGMVFINFGRNSIAIIFTQYLTLDTGLNLDSRTLSQIVNTQSAAIVALGWTAGWICRRIGNGAALLAGSLAAVTALALLTFATALPLIYAACFLRGVGDAIIMASAYTFASVLIPPQMRGRLFGWFNGTFFLSFGVAGTLIAGPIVDGMISAGYAQSRAYRLSFAAAAGLTIIGLLIQAALLWFLRKQKSAATGQQAATE
ncbi:MAG: MFS transporter [Desulfobacterales bacterium]|jgi:MFS family permease